MATTEQPNKPKKYGHTRNRPMMAMTVSSETLAVLDQVAAARNVSRGVAADMLVRSVPLDALLKLATVDSPTGT